MKILKRKIEEIEGIEEIEEIEEIEDMNLHLTFDLLSSSKAIKANICI